MQKLCGVLGVVLLLGTVGPLSAEEGAPLVVVHDKAQMLRLSVPAHRVIVANPNIADVSVETPTLLTVFGRGAGETSITVLGADDRVIMNRPVVVTDEPDRQVTVHVPGSDGAVSRHYSCVANRCLKTASPEALAAAGAAPSTAPAATNAVSPSP